MHELPFATKSSTPASNLADATDAQLVTQFTTRRDQAAFTALLQRHGPMVFGICRRIVRRHHEAEDAFQATFLSLAQNASRIAKPAQLANWLHSVARHAALQAQKIASQRQQIEQRLDEQMDAISKSPPAQEDHWSDLAPVLDQEIERLSADLRITVLLCDVEGKTRKEAARQLGWPEATVSTRLMKARSLLAQRLTRRGVTLTASTLAVLLSQQAASAAVPASLVASTLQTAGISSAAQVISASAASPTMTAIAQGTVKSMLLVNLKIAAVALTAMGIASWGFLAPREEREAVSEAKIQKIEPGVELTEVPPEVIQALEENASRLNPISISYTVQLKSLMSEEETRARLKLAKDDPVFRPCFYRRIWQDEKYYNLREPVDRVDVTKDEKRRPFSVQDQFFDERSFDGQIIYYGSLGPKHEGMLFKSRDSLIERVNRYARNANFDYSHPYFNIGTLLSGGFTGLYFHEELGQDVGPQAKSNVLYYLNSSAYQLISVANVTVDDRPLLKIEFQGENPHKTWADQEDIDKLKRDEAFLNEPPEQQKRRLEFIVNARKLPATKRVVFYLDPALHYAVRQKEEWYDPETLISRCRCSDFEQLSNRQVWLPRKCEVDERTFNNKPEVEFTAPALLKVILVSELSGERVPDESFVINYTEPGVRIVDVTAAQREEYVTGKTPAETAKNQETAQKRALDPAQYGPATEQPPSQSAGHWFLLANSAALLSLGAFLAYRRFMNK